MQRLLLTFIALAATGAASAQGANWVAGKHYSVIPTQRTQVATGKVEILEVFSYGCPACNTFLPVMKLLKSSLPANAQVNYLPASWNAREAWPLFQQAFITAQSLGVSDKTHEAMFDAIWGTRELGVVDPNGRVKQNLPTIEDVARFYERVAGVKAADFVAAARSSTVDLKMRQADRKITAMQVASTPTLVVAGKYRINQQNMTPLELVALVKHLVTLESKPAVAAPVKQP